MRVPSKGNVSGYEHSAKHSHLLLLMSTSETSQLDFNHITIDFKKSQVVQQLLTSYIILLLFNISCFMYVFHFLMDIDLEENNK